MSPAVRTDKENAKKNNEILTNNLKEQGVPYITTDIYIYTTFILRRFTIKLGRFFHSR